ncbi:ParB/RepB/Spo0J family partition protein [Deinococcus xianganensis]|uniref:ParB/RepB/Spo0J family partition protein n=1 Tax=Deinococcus xianganensis TaxID=1507289 RepID=A0A6I4YUK7_9DEIO|nr:ParB/RepB/Spo0J family partition protein [Deinococcus xianganensis]MXV20793.1 ParB/RepB/Spo0J family partition protein [Deinococcus xianganensis]
MPTPAPTAPAAATTGWMHPNNAPLAHWYNGTRVLCGRSIPTGTKVVSSDPHAEVKKCLKCSAAVAKLHPAAPADATPRPSTDPAELAAQLQPRHYVRVTVGGQEIVAGVLMATDDTVVVMQPSGQHAPVPRADCTPTTLPPRTDLAPGDLIISPGSTGLWRVTAFDAETGTYSCAWTHDSEITMASTGDDVQVFQRDTLAGMFADLGINSTEPDDLAPDQPAEDFSPEGIAAARAAFPFKKGDVITNGTSTRRVLYLDANHFGMRELDDPVTNKRHTGMGITWIPYARASGYRIAELEPVNPSEVPEPTRFQIPDFEPVSLGMQQVPWNKILPSPLNPRKAFEAAALRELAISIHGEGLQQNLVVRPHPDRHGFYEIAAGERRYRAIGLLVTGFEREGHEWVEVPDSYPVNVLVQQLTDLELLQKATAENVQRRRMTPLEEADAFAAMIDRGATVAQLHALFGLGQRTITRRVEISRHLIPDLRAMYDAGKLTLGQVEILAQATPGLQEHLLRHQLRHTPATTPEQLKYLIRDTTFPTSRAQFPRAWYTGTVTAADLFGDLPERFDDRDQAMALQVKHAVALAQEDIRQGAVFADVREDPETQLWRYQKAEGGVDSGVVYNVNSKTGELTRHPGYLTQAQYMAPNYRFEAPRPAPTHETPDKPASSGTTPTAAAQAPAASSPAALAPARPRYAVHSLKLDVATQLAARPTAGLAALIYAYAYEGWGYLETAASRTAAEELARLTGGMLTTDQRTLTLGSDDDQGQFGLHHVLPALLAAPEQVLLDVWQGMTASMIESALDLDSAGHLIQSRHAEWTLTEAYLAACDTLALHEIWDDAELGDRTNTTDEYLRSVLLEEAPKLAARRFLPRVLRPTDAEGVLA